ncbi:MAG: Uma2 family endonuclease [Isosphaeraceae bacterium]
MNTTTIKGLSVETYDKMVEKGILPESNRFELIEGRIVEKMTKEGPHCGSSERSWRLIDALLPPGWHVRIEKPVRIPSRKSEPEPDVSVARGSHKDYDDRHPGPGDVALVVEITDSSLRKDRRLARVYAAAAIPAYWIIDVRRRCVERFAGPDEGEYRSHEILGEGDSIDLVIEGRVLGQIAVADLLPEKRN